MEWVCSISVETRNGGRVAAVFTACLHSLAPPVICLANQAGVPLAQVQVYGDWGTSPTQPPALPQMECTPMIRNDNADPVGAKITGTIPREFVIFGVTFSEIDNDRSHLSL